MRVTPKLFWAVYELTVKYARDPLKYREAFGYVCRCLNNDMKYLLYRPGFHVRKGSGGYRVIHPAWPDLRLVQGVHAQFLKAEVHLGWDHCYVLTWDGVMSALGPHRLSPKGITFDLKAAFSYVTAEKLWFWLAYHRPDLSPKVVELFVDLWTYRGSRAGRTVEGTPQGCVITPFAYNVVVLYLDWLLDDLGDGQELIITRYADDVCVSWEGERNVTLLQEEIRHIVRVAGFELSFLEYHEGEIPWLGTVIRSGRFFLSEEKLGEFIQLLQEAVASPTPGIYRSQILGMWSWATQVMGRRIPRGCKEVRELFALFEAYWGRVGMTPAEVANVLATGYMEDMFEQTA